MCGDTAVPQGPIDGDLQTSGLPQASHWNRHLGKGVAEEDQ